MAFKIKHKSIDYPVKRMVVQTEPTQFIEIELQGYKPMRMVGADFKSNLLYMSASEIELEAIKEMDKKIPNKKI